MGLSKIEGVTITCETFRCFQYVYCSIDSIDWVSFIYFFLQINACCDKVSKWMFYFCNSIAANAQKVQKKNRRREGSLFYKCFLQFFGFVHLPDTHTHIMIYSFGTKINLSISHSISVAPIIWIECTKFLDFVVVRRL